MIGAYAALLLVLGMGILIPLFIRWIIDTGIEGGQVHVLTWSAAALLAMTVLKGILNYYIGLFTEKASQNVAFDLRNELQRKLTQLSFSFHDKSETGELLSRAVQDVERVRFLTGRATLRIVEGVLLLVTTAVVLLVMNFKLGALTLLLMPLLIFQAVRYGTRFRPLSMQVQSKIAALTTAVEQNLRGSRVVKAYAQEDAEIERFEAVNRDWFNLSNRSGRMQAFNVPLLFLIANLGIVVIIYFGGMQFIKGSVTIGTIVAFISYLGNLIEPVRRLGMIIPAVAIAGSASERIFDVLDTVSEVRDTPGARTVKEIQGRVRFEGVSFHYGHNRVLKDISFDVQPGSRVALLGLTGSGKSSIINLIPRFYDPTAGRILIDEKDIRSIKLQSLRSHIGIVLQETTLFASTIRENIAFSNDKATDEEVIRAAVAAQAHEFIMQSVDGYNTKVGERGVTLSGGQKQRIAIARALLLNPRILIFDDATASVDTETERLIQLALEELSQGRTTFIIAQRLSTVRNADLILVLEGGSLSAQGTHEELLRESGVYRSIYNQQLRKQEEL
ncbi:MAG: ABC transporter ATP-binding protein [Anaerolineaceae bacterium]|nr:ABC transporter ATP-binding protein [Anaerolineaceae bacterium]